MRLPAPRLVRAAPAVPARVGRDIAVAPSRVDIGAALQAALAPHGWLGVPLLGAVVSRLWSLELLRIAARERHLPLFGTRAVTVTWDTKWYLEIATSGYHRAPIAVNAVGGQHDYAFFPLWPMVIKAVSFFGVSPATAAVVFSPVLFCVAAVLIAAALAPVFGRAVATDATLLLAFSPAAFTFSLGYSEGLFLVLAAAAFLASQPGRRALAVGLAVATRIAGLPLIAVDALRFLQSRGRDVGALAVAFVGATAFAGWWIAVAVISGDPLGFLHGSPDWAPITGVWQVVHVVELPDIERVPALVVTAVIAIGAIAVLPRSRPMALYAILTIGLGLLPGGFVSSMPRYALAAFPAFGGLAWLAGRRGTAVLIVISAIAQLVFVALAYSAGKGHLLAP